MPVDARTRWLSSLSDDEARLLNYTWRYWARPAQLPPDSPFLAWLILAGRGFGKTRAGAEWVRAAVHDNAFVNIIGATADDARDIMIEGESGILAVCPPWERPEYKPSKRQLEWPNGAKSLIFTADEPERLRGKQHMKAWADELGAWRYARDAWDQLMFGLRLGARPQVCVTTTPRPNIVLLELIADVTTVITRGTTYENVANLSPAFFTRVINRYEGTDLGRQELLAEVLTEIAGALWKRAMFNTRKVPPDLTRVVVAIDPAAKNRPESDETGIMVAGQGVDADYYVLADRTCKLSPDGWARRAIAAFDEFHADRIVAEVNNGGDMVETVIRTIRPDIPYTAVTATRGKAVRAEPVAALYEQRRVWHTPRPHQSLFIVTSLGQKTHLDMLEDELCTWTQDSGWSPGRLDSLVWAMTELHKTGRWGAR